MRSQMWQEWCPGIWTYRDRWVILMATVCLRVAVCLERKPATKAQKDSMKPVRK